MPLGKPKPRIVVSSAQPVRPARGRAALELARDHAHALKLPMPELPVDGVGAPVSPQLPYNIDEVPLPDLGRLYGQFAAMASYAARHVGEADVESSETKYKLTIIEAQAMLSSDGANAAERKSNVALDPQVMEASEAHRAADAKFTLLSKLLAGYERSMATISREFSRRGLDVKG
jgi:hypothetical protein